MKLAKTKNRELIFQVLDEDDASELLVIYAEDGALCFAPASRRKLWMDKREAAAFGRKLLNWSRAQ